MQTRATTSSARIPFASGGGKQLSLESIVVGFMTFKHIHKKMPAAQRKEWEKEISLSKLSARVNNWCPARAQKKAETQMNRFPRRT